MIYIEYLGQKRGGRAPWAPSKSATDPYMYVTPYQYKASWRALKWNEKKNPIRL